MPDAPSAGASPPRTRSAIWTWAAIRLSAGASNESRQHVVVSLDVDRFERHVQLAALPSCTGRSRRVCTCMSARDRLDVDLGSIRYLPAAAERPHLQAMAVAQGGRDLVGQRATQKVDVSDRIACSAAEARRPCGRWDIAATSAEINQHGCRNRQSRAASHEPPAHARPAVCSAAWPDLPRLSRASSASATAAIQMRARRVASATGGLADAAPGSPQAASAMSSTKHRVGDVRLPSRRQRLAEIAGNELIEQHAEGDRRRTPLSAICPASTSGATYIIVPVSASLPPVRTLRESQVGDAERASRAGDQE